MKNILIYFLRERLNKHLQKECRNKREEIKLIKSQVSEQIQTLKEDRNYWMERCFKAEENGRL